MGGWTLWCGWASSRGACHQDMVLQGHYAETCVQTLGSHGIVSAKCQREILAQMDSDMHCNHEDDHLVCCD